MQHKPAALCYFKPALQFARVLKNSAYTKAGHLPLAGSCEKEEVKATSAPTYAGQASA